MSTSQIMLTNMAKFLAFKWEVVPWLYSVILEFSRKLFQAEISLPDHEQSLTILQEDWVSQIFCILKAFNRNFKIQKLS